MPDPTEIEEIDWDDLTPEQEAIAQASVLRGDEKAMPDGSSKGVRDGCL